MANMKTKAAVVAALEKAGKVTARRLVEASRSKKHPLHKEFKWGTSGTQKAAMLWRLDHAREVIASVRVVSKTTVHRVTSVAWVRDPDASPKEQGYVSIATLRDDRQYAERALDAEVDRIKSVLERAREFASVLDLSEELEVALRSIITLHSRSRRGPPGIVVDNRPSI